jgi:hypothetical protein
LATKTKTPMPPPDDRRARRQDRFLECQKNILATYAKTFRDLSGITFASEEDVQKAIKRITRDHEALIKALADGDP